MVYYAQVECLNLPIWEKLLFALGGKGLNLLLTLFHSMSLKACDTCMTIVTAQTSKFIAVAFCIVIQINLSLNYS